MKASARTVVFATNSPWENSNPRIAGQIPEAEREEAEFNSCLEVGRLLKLG